MLTAIFITTSNEVDINSKKEIIVINHEYLIKNGYTTNNNKKYIQKKIKLSELKKIFNFNDDDMLLISNYNYGRSNNLNLEYTINLNDEWNMTIYNVIVNIIDLKYVIENDCVVTSVVNHRNIQIPTKSN